MPSRNPKRSTKGPSRSTRARRPLSSSPGKQKTQTPDPARINPGLAGLVVPVGKLKLDPDNARDHSDEQVKMIADSLARWGQQKPIVTTRGGIVAAGNGVLMAARALGWLTIAAVPFDTDDPVEARAFALADNRLGELSTWIEATLRSQVIELAESRREALVAWADDAIAALRDEVDEPNYSRKLEPPTYEPQSEQPPPIEALAGLDTYRRVIANVDKAGVAGPLADFLRLAATRHVVFDYQRIAEFYAHADAPTQRLFEDSALVILDVRDAIARGFARLAADMADAYDRDDEERSA